MRRAGSTLYSPMPVLRSMLRSAITEEFYDSIFDINVKGLLSTVQKALPLLVSDGASIILTASVVSQQRVGDERF